MQDLLPLCLTVLPGVEELTGKVTGIFYSAWILVTLLLSQNKSENGVSASLPFFIQATHTVWAGGH